MTIININDRIEDLTYGEFFNVQLHNGDNPAVELSVDFTGIPTKTLAKLAWDTMKVKFRPHVKGMSTEAFLKAFNHKTITWREMITKSGASAKISNVEKSPEEIAGEIERLQQLLQAKKAAPTAVETSETNDDINSENYVPKNHQN